MVKEEEDILVTPFSKEVEEILDNPCVSYISHGNIWTLGIGHCSASKVVNVASNDQNFQSSAVSVDYSIGKVAKLYSVQSSQV